MRLVWAPRRRNRGSGFHHSCLGWEGLDWDWVGREVGWDTPRLGDVGMGAAEAVVAGGLGSCFSLSLCLFLGFGWAGLVVGGFVLGCGGPRVRQRVAGSGVRQGGG